MAKPVIVTRAGKGTALTWTEGDNNLTNLQNATITVKAGTSGTDVVSDLNGTVTLVAGTNVTLSGDNTAKTVTINAAGGSGITDLVQDTTPQLGGNLDVQARSIVTSGTNQTIEISPSGTGFLRVGDGTFAARITTKGAYNLALSTNDNTDSGLIVINQGANANIGIVPNGAGRVGIGGQYVLPLTAPTAGQVLTATDTFTTAFATPSVAVSTGISGLGTGVATFLATPSSANLISAVTDETGTGSLVFANTPTLVSPVLGTPTSGNLANCTFPTLNQNTTGTADNVTGTVAIANGGTGQTTRQNAMDALAGAVTSGQYLRGNGSDVVMSAIQAADVPTLNQNTTGTAAGLSATLSLASGGTGQTSAPAANAALMGFTTTATAAGTTTLTNTSSSYQLFTGSSTQTVTLPSTATLALGWSFHIVNNSTGNLTLNTSTAANLGTIVPGTTVMATVISTAGNTAAAWEFGFTDFSTLSGTGAVVLATTPTLTTPVVTGIREGTVFALGTTGGTITPNVANGNVQSITLNSALTINAFTSPLAGQTLTLIINGGTAYTAITSTMKFAGGIKTLTATAGCVDILTVFYDGTNYWASLGKGFA